jgi:hypothetical protein
VRQEAIIVFLAGPVAESIHDERPSDTLADFEARYPWAGEPIEPDDDFPPDLTAARSAARGEKWWDMDDAGVLPPWPLAKGVAVLRDDAEVDAYLERLWAHTRALLVSNWCAVEALAKALEGRTSLPGLRAHKIISKALEAAPRPRTPVRGAA